jgi:hypothetical protein
LDTIFLSIDPTTNLGLDQINYKPNQYDIQNALMNYGGAGGSPIANFQWDQLQYDLNYDEDQKTGTAIIVPIPTCLQYSGRVIVSFNWVN